MHYQMVVFVLNKHTSFFVFRRHMYMQPKYEDFELTNLFLVNGLCLYGFDCEKLKQGFLISFGGNIAQLCS